ncbi:nuclear transport factor 2 family protein [Flavobacteriaceae bacterium]|nr:nuclear transport factor 2 family protein [Flavobacteriaceae bacterium]|tara:strand:- start:28 stop:477 length:450 start_codon:yes stop_codon:yes gene_type:complete
MKKLLLLLLFIPLVSFGQGLEKEKLKSVVNTFFEGFHSKDSLLIVSVIDKSFDLNSTSLKEDNGVLTNINGDNFVSAIISRPDSPVWKEKLLSFNIKIDGPLANVWVDYEFWIDDKLSHCGANSIHLLKKKSGWKIFNITDSRRINCNN